MPKELRVTVWTASRKCRPGDDLGGGCCPTRSAASGMQLEAGDVLVVTHKIVSKSEGRLVDLRPSSRPRWRLIVRSVSARTRARSRSCCARACASCAWSAVCIISRDAAWLHLRQRRRRRLQRAGRRDVSLLAARPRRVGAQVARRRWRRASASRRRSSLATLSAGPGARASSTSPSAWPASRR